MHTDMDNVRLLSHGDLQLTELGHSGGIKVYGRIKPPNQEQSLNQMQYNINKRILTLFYKKHNPFIDRVGRTVQQNFQFTQFFAPQCSQEDVIKRICNPILRQTRKPEVKGALIFAYGGANSGKTYTILGTKQNPGVLSYLLYQLLQSFGSKYQIQKQVNKVMFEQKQNQCINIPVGKRSIEKCRNSNSEISVPEKDYKAILGGDRNSKQSISSQKYGIKLTCVKLWKEVFYTYFDDKNYDQQSKMQQIEFTESSLFITRDNLEEVLQLCYKHRNKEAFSTKKSHGLFKIQIDDKLFLLIDLATKLESQDITGQYQIQKSSWVINRCISALRLTRTYPEMGIPFRQSKLTQQLPLFFTSSYRVTMIVPINLQKSAFKQNLRILSYANEAMQIKQTRPFFVKQKQIRVKNYVSSSLSQLRKNQKDNRDNKKSYHSQMQTESDNLFSGFVFKEKSKQQQELCASEKKKSEADKRSQRNKAFKKKILFNASVYTEVNKQPVVEKKVMVQKGIDPISELQSHFKQHKENHFQYQNHKKMEQQQINPWKIKFIEMQHKIIDLQAERTKIDDEYREKIKQFQEQFCIQQQQKRLKQAALKMQIAQLQQMDIKVQHFYSSDQDNPKNKIIPPTKNNTIFPTKKAQNENLKENPQITLFQRLSPMIQTIIMIYRKKLKDRLSVYSFDIFKYEGCNNRGKKKVSFSQDIFQLAPILQVQKNKKMQQELSEQQKQKEADYQVYQVLQQNPGKKPNKKEKKMRKTKKSQECEIMKNTSKQSSQCQQQDNIAHRIRGRTGKRGKSVSSSKQ